MNFEEKLERLKELVEKLESGDALELDASLTLFEEGIGLVRSCRTYLEAAEVRVKNVSEQLDSAEVSEPMPPDDGNGEYGWF